MFNIDSMTSGLFLPAEYYSLWWRAPEPPRGRRRRQVKWTPVCSLWPCVQTAWSVHELPGSFSETLHCPPLTRVESWTATSPKEPQWAWLHAFLFTLWRTIIDESLRYLCTNRSIWQSDHIVFCSGHHNHVWIIKNTHKIIPLIL